MILSNIEFYSTPDGEVMIKEHNQPVRKLEEEDRNLVQTLFIIIRDRYPVAFERLSELYSRSERNRNHFEFKIIHRFALRGECQDEGVICKPQLDSKLSFRELEVIALIADGLQAAEIADELSISTATVNRHRENIKAKLKLKTVGQMVNYYLTNIKK